MERNGIERASEAGSKDFKMIFEERLYLKGVSYELVAIQRKCNEGLYDLKEVIHMC